MKKWNPEPGRISFNPRTPCGGRPIACTTSCESGRFNPRTPCGVRRPPPQAASTSTPFQSTHSLRSATHPLGDELTRCAVSIHALLAECDKMTSSPGLASCSFNPRTPCGVRLWQDRLSCPHYRFQSTHSLRSAT